VPRPFLFVSLLALVAFAPLAQAAPDLLTRPKFQIAVGLGASIDRAAPNPHPDRPLTSFFFGAGLGAGLLGFDLRSFANGASKVQVTRLSLELVAVVRPLVLAMSDSEHYLARVARSASLDLGPAFERVSQAAAADWRQGVLLGAHVDLPVGTPGSAKELRLRLGGRRMIGTTASLSDTPIVDTTVELYGQLAFVF
jgi:hypothetical protein